VEEISLSGGNQGIGGGGVEEIRGLEGFEWRKSV
jgi:hypothetical protein